MNRSIKAVIYAVIDAVYVALAVYISLLFRFDFMHTEIDPVFASNAIKFLPIQIIVVVTIFALMKFYHSLWEFASIKEYSLIILAVTAATFVNTTLRLMLKLMVPRSCIILEWMLICGLVCMSKIFVRVWKKKRHHKKAPAVRTMIIGAGTAANMLMRDISINGGRTVVCLIDDDKAKIGARVNGVKVAGGRDKIIQAAEKYRVNEIIFAIPSAHAAEKAEILNICKNTGVPLKTLPAISELVENEIGFSSVKDVNVEDLLGREPIRTDIDSIIGYIANKTVLVTGGGGSIGSELCRQIASHKPAKLIIFDVYENNAYDIGNEIKNRYPMLPLEVLIGSVRDSRRVESVFNKYKPQIVFHAAAHKHVPLMEDSPQEAVKNNVFGTKKVAEAADRHGAERFILISTDKAVNPTNIMGATKRICEMVIQTVARNSKTVFAAVRFGNVLGSNGSVIPLFEKQIAQGGPVTVTSPDIIRFFMTIPEAVGLVLRAGSMAKGGEIFVLDMGKPVKIIDLAENLIRLSGKVPYEEIPIVFTGLRPGEKMYEEILTLEEGLQTTADDTIFVCRPPEFDADSFIKQLDELNGVMYDETVCIKDMISRIVPIREPDNK